MIIKLLFLLLFLILKISFINCNITNNNSNNNNNNNKYNIDNINSSSSSDGNSDGSNDIIPISQCNQLNSDFYVQTFDPSFEDCPTYQTETKECGWKGSVFEYTDNSYQGEICAVFKSSNDMIISNPIIFANFTNPQVTNLFSVMTFNFQYQFRFIPLSNSSSSDSSDSSDSSNGFTSSESTLLTGHSLTGTSGGSSIETTGSSGNSQDKIYINQQQQQQFNKYSKLDQKNNNINNNYNYNYNKNNNNLIPDYISVYVDNNLILNISSVNYLIESLSYQKATVNITKFCDGNKHNITFKYIETGYYKSLGLEQIIRLDYISFVPIPNKIIDDDIYISNNGDDFVGNGSLTNSFCSIQRAIYSIADNRNIYLVGDVNITQVFKNQYSLVDLIGKNINFYSYGNNSNSVVNNSTSKTTIYTNFNNSVVFLIDSNQVKFTNINMVSLFPNSAFMVSYNSSLEISNFQFDFIRLINSTYSNSAISVNRYSNFTIFNGIINECYWNCIYTIGINSVIQNVFFNSSIGVPISFGEAESSMQILNCSFNPFDPKEFEIIRASTFKNLTIDSIILYGDLESDEQVPIVGINNGKNAFISNIQLFNLVSSLSIEALDVENLIIQDLSTLYYSYYENSFILIDDCRNVVIRNLNLLETSTQAHPYIQVNGTNKLWIDNCTYVGNPTSFVTAYEVFNFTLTNSVFLNNTDFPSVLVSNCNVYVNNITMKYSSVQFISISKSKLQITNSNFIENQNFDTSQDIPLIYMIYMKESSMSNINVSSNFNFEVVKIINSQALYINSSEFNNQQLGNMFGIQNSKFTLQNSLLFNNFLGQSYPIHSINSNIQLLNCSFQMNTQYFFLYNSTFQFNQTSFNNIITVSQKSYLIYNSIGSFNYVDILNTNPHLGIIVDYSKIVYNGCTFEAISSYNNTLGLYTDSYVIFDRCTFISNTAGFNMATFVKNTTIFQGCSFRDHSSIEVSIFSSINQDLLLLNNTAFTSCSSKADGVRIKNSTVIIENFNLYYNAIEGYTFNMDQVDISFIDIDYEGCGNMLASNSNVGITNLTIQVYDGQLERPLFILNNSTVSLENSTFSSIVGTDSLFSLSYSYIKILNTMFNQIILTNGSIIDTYQSSVYIENSSFLENQNEDGGACLTLNDNNGNDTIVNSEFSKNSAQYGSVGSFFAAAVTFIGCKFSFNQVSFVGTVVDVYGCGGVFVLQGSVVNVLNSSLEFSSAEYYGGVAFLYGPGNFMFFNNSFLLSNTVSFGSGAVCFSQDYAGCYSDGNTKFNLNSALYGNNFASYPESLHIQSQNFSIHPNTEYTIVVELIDYYNQSMSFLNYQIQFSVEVSINNQLVQNYSISQYQGSIEVSGNPLNYSINDIVRISAAAKFSVINDSTLTTAIEIPLTHCSIGYAPNSSNGNCVPCSIGTYGYDGFNCFECDSSKAICPGKNIIYPQEGYWVYSNGVEEPIIYACDPAYCQSRQCRQGQGGVLCSVCEPGYSKVKMYCEKCEGFNVLLLIGMVFFYLILILFLNIFSVPSASIILNYLLVVQIIAVMGYNIQYLAILPLFIFTIDYWPSSCLDPHVTFLWKQVISYGIIFLIVIPLSIKFSWGKKIMIKLLPRFKIFVLELFDKNLIYSLISILITLYTPITYISLSLVSCSSIGNSYYLSLDPSVECFTSKHLPLFIFACIALALVTVGAPLYISIQIRRKNRYFTKIFFEKYRSNFIWWDILLMVRSVLYIIVTFAFAFSYIDIKGLVMSTMGLFFTFITWMCKPFKSQYKNELESYLSLIVTLVGLIINTRALTSIDIFSGIILSLSGVFALIPVAVTIGHIIQKIYNKGIQTTNPTTTKTKNRQDKSNNNYGENDFDPLLNNSDYFN